VTVSTIAKPQVGPDPREPKSIDHGNPLTPDIGSVSMDVRRHPIFLTNMDFTLGSISVDSRKCGQTHSQTKVQAFDQVLTVHRHGVGNAVDDHWC
jgi:hypothetical protein